MIVCCGEALIDFIPTPDGTGYRPCPGGSILNIAVGLGRLGTPVGFLSRLSTDIFGTQLAKHMLKDGVNLDTCPRVEGQTTLAFVSLNQDGSVEPQYAFYATGAVDRDITISDLPDALDETIQAMHFGSISMVLEPGASTFEHLLQRESEKRIISLDPNVRPGLIQDQSVYQERFANWMHFVDILKLSQADFSYIYPGKKIDNFLEEWFAQGVRMVILTEGSKGSRGFLQGGVDVFIAAPRVTVKDTVGAGDSFFSAVLAYLYTNQKLHAKDSISGLTAGETKECLRFASKAAAINCTREGADPPYRHEMEEIES